MNPDDEIDVTSDDEAAFQRLQASTTVLAQQRQEVIGGKAVIITYWADGSVTATPEEGPAA